MEPLLFVDSHVILFSFYYWNYFKLYQKKKKKKKISLFTHLESGERGDIGKVCDTGDSTIYTNPPSYAKDTETRDSEPLPILRQIQMSKLHTGAEAVHGL